MVVNTSVVFRRRQFPACSWQRLEAIFDILEQSAKYVTVTKPRCPACLLPFRHRFDTPPRVRPRLPNGVMVNSFHRIDRRISAIFVFANARIGICYCNVLQSALLLLDAALDACGGETG